MVTRASDGSTLIAIADVSGKGHAVLGPAGTIARFLDHAWACRTPAAILQRLNEAMLAEPINAASDMAHAALFLARYSPDRRRLTYASAGHPTAHLVRSSTTLPLPATGMLLGIERARFDEQTVDVAIGDTLIVATNGLTDARDVNGNVWRDRIGMDITGACDTDSVVTALRRFEAIVHRFADYCLPDDRALIVARTNA